MRAFVDTLRPCPPGRAWRWPALCHLFSDSLPDLRLFATQLGLWPESLNWSRSGIPHYHLTPELRQRAITLGAITIGRTETGLLARFWRRHQQAILANLAHPPPELTKRLRKLRKPR